METHLKSCQYKLIKFAENSPTTETSFVKCEQCTECCSSVKLQRDNEPTCMVSSYVILSNNCMILQYAAYIGLPFSHTAVF